MLDAMFAALMGIPVFRLADSEAIPMTMREMWHGITL